MRFGNRKKIMKHHERVVLIGIRAMGREGRPACKVQGK